MTAADYAIIGERRALLPIADVTTADLQLPPRPLADDLPGDGG